ncbi:MAG: DUF262 domain-containing protein [Candidatus Yonathbacteria bacterium]|nr:DUF262 domain-containing protein [Candidatus Yonathbacteria bacterium]NTW47855.1 DUF262 domain-containing protein [Candidatus Yonathbacteria bacterium]
MNNIKKFIDTNPYTYSTLCDRYKRFSMPLNQRPYAWKISNISELWSAILENEEGYFVGNLVCLDPSDESNGTLVVVDGQQRLTTISLILIAIKDILIECNDGTKKTTQLINWLTNSLLWQDPKTYEYFPRLIHSKENLLEAYKNILENGNEIPKNIDDNQMRYYSNIRYIKSLIKKEIKAKSDDQIEKLIQKILSLQFIAIVVNSENDIYDLFEGLNSTGLGLSVADLLKNSVLKFARKGRAREEIEADWIQMESYFEATKTSLFPKFLRHYYISENGLISSSRLFKTLKKEKIENKQTQEVVAFVKELLENAQIYMGLRFDEYESNLNLLVRDRESKKIIRTFEYVGSVDQVYAVLLAFYNKKRHDPDYKPSSFKRDIRQLLKFVILARFVSINPSEYEKIFGDMCEISTEYSGVKYEKEIGQHFKKLFNLVNKKDEFVSNFSNEIEYGRDSKLIEYLLQEVMREYSKEDRGITVLNPNIEHILPRSPKKWGLDKEDIGSYVNKIGNLTILHDLDNNDAGNETFEEKMKKVYSVSKFRFNNDISKYEEVFVENPSLAIEQRGKDISTFVFSFLKSI